MVAEAPEPVRRRRHGPQLESALLAAAWDELVEVGYAHLTMESIARRARTSEPVLYRRWANKDQLVLAAIEHRRAAHPIAIPDTGALRSDLIEYLTDAGNALAGTYAIGAAAFYSGLPVNSGMTPAQVRARIMGGQLSPHQQTIYQRAHDRGEIDLDRIPGPVLDMPFELLRHDLLMNLQPPSPTRIRSVVDDLFLATVHHHQTDASWPWRHAARPAEGSSR